MVFEEGLDKSRLPEALKEDLNQLDRLEGQFRMTTTHMEIVDRKGPLCPICDLKEEMKTDSMKQFVEQYKPITTLSKVILSGIATLRYCDVFYQSLLKVEVGSEMYKKGIRWTEFCQMEPFTTDVESEMKFMVLDYILTISITILQDSYHDHPVTLAMLIIIIIISQELGHASFKKNVQLENELGIDEVTINSLIIRPT